MQQFWQNDDDSSDKSCVIAMVVMGFACAILSGSSRSILVEEQPLQKKIYLELQI